MLQVTGLKIVQKDPENSRTSFHSLSDFFCLLIPVPILSVEILGFINNDVLDPLRSKCIIHEGCPGHCLADIFFPVTVKNTLGVSLTTSYSQKHLLFQITLLTNSQEPG